jgi:hypothetical protein
MPNISSPRAEARHSADAATADLTRITETFGASAESEEASCIATMLHAHQQLQDKIDQLAMGQGNDAMGRAYDMLKTEESAQQGELMDRLQKLVNAQQEKTNQEIQALADASHAATLALWTTTQGAEETNEAVQKLSKMATELRYQVSQFKYESNGAGGPIARSTG